ncbi:hypothetical protein [Amycolatopsis azurea]|uniref:Rho termination factor N-terminal domain-containing protein n=1 Tax=Amycolatopsis azurea DSM 43854 TaxID=1238180 RepID=M2QN73_9PSEU|nr:hypothetical protein [Amycolatopsis azurea]EMD27272.1 hypothetical protein C791_2284 [Amycolatopsis azurea DSM 43854]OOC03690.1 hypothetical protein B0293_25785 [Amycolatopsis azurea DSM 43854]
MNELKSVVALQARVYEFLERQDEATLLAIVSGEARLAISRDGDTQVSSSGPAPEALLPSGDPELVAQELSKPASEDQRRIFLRATGLPVTGLRRVARLRGLRGYSGLTKAGLIDHLASPGTEQLGTPRKSRQAKVALQPETARADAEVASIAARLREMETVEEGAAYLDTLQLDRDGLRALAAALQLTRVDRLNQAELEKRVLKQAIGSRRKFSGLGKW